MARTSFQDLIRPTDGLPVLVDFFADWCGPCHALAPMLQQVARQHTGRLRVVKLDVDKNPAVAQQFRVQSIPTLILFKGGAPVWRQSGAQSAEALSRALQPHLSA
jgi:thioredoxin 1